MQELFHLAQDVAGESDRGKRFSPPLSHDELAFYDAVSQNDSAVLGGAVKLVIEQMEALAPRDVEGNESALRCSRKRRLPDAEQWHLTHWREWPDMIRAPGRKGRSRG